MTVRRTRRQSAPKPVALTEPTAMRKAHHLPMFGPGIEIRIPLHLWPAYKDLYGLDVLPPQLPAHERIKQTVLLVKRVPKEKAA